MAAQALGNRRAQRFARPATDVIWFGPTQQSGVNHLCAETQIRVLIGPASSGKTTLLRHFQHHLDDVLTLHVPGPHGSGADLLSALLEAASLGPTDADLTEAEQRRLLRVFIEQRGMGTRIIICADEISGCSTEAWIEIERLLSLRAGNKLLVELAVVCTDEHAADSRLGRVVATGATSAVEAVRYLPPPSDDDLRRYIAWQLERIGAAAAFSEEACGRIVELCESRYGAANVLCESILSARARNGGKPIDVDAVNRAAGLVIETEAAGLVTEAEGLVEPLAISSEETLPDRLVIARNGRIERIVSLDRRLVIGRGETSDLRLAGRDVCRHHAIVMPSGDGRFAIVDLNSGRGVFVNGKRVKRQVLRNGDVVKLGQYRMRLITAGVGRRGSDAERASIEPRAARELARSAVAPVG